MSRIQNTGLEFSAGLDISRGSGGHYNDYPMRVVISDGTSGCRILEARFSLEGFMRALTSQCGIEGKGILYSGPYGYKSQLKDEVLPRPKKHKDDVELDSLLRPFEVDGWRGDKSDLTNHHHWVGENEVRVGFRRFVNETGEVWVRES